MEPPQDAVTIRNLRRGIAYVGLALPLVLPIGNALLERRLTLLPSLSDAYYTGMRDVFVGGLCAIGVFLISYRYGKPDDVLSTIAGVLAVLVALFPTAPGNPTSTAVAIGWVHAVAAVSLFAILAYFCIFLFTRSNSAKANRVYYLCGGVILAGMVLALASNLLPDAVRHAVRPRFWCEAVAVFAFGFAWLVKGEALFKDATDRAP
jgi:hypothetical protein